MFCLKCGAKLPDGSVFCPQCGEQLANDPTPDVSSISPPAMNQPSAKPKKKRKALPWVLVGIGAAVGAALVLIFVVFAPAGAWPFRGNTVQTRFANDAVAVAVNAFSGAPQNSLTQQAMTEPFEINLDYETRFSGIDTEIDIEAAYDENALGVNLTTTTDFSGSLLGDLMSEQVSGESVTKLLLIEDVLYIDADGSTTGLKFKSHADLSKAMPLGERFAALLGSDQTSNANSLKLAEMFLNCIDKSCFTTGDGTATMTLDETAVADALDRLAEKVKDDEALKGDLSRLVKTYTGHDDIAGAVSDMRDAPFALICTVESTNGKPSRLAITHTQSGETVDMAFDYENKENGRNITLEITDDSGQTLTVEVLAAKTEKGLKLTGKMNLADLKNIPFEIEQNTSGSEVWGTIAISLPYFNTSIDYDGTVDIGMPRQAVQNDKRFEVDTKNAQIVDFGSMDDMALPELPVSGMAS